MDNNQKENSNSTNTIESNKQQLALDLSASEILAILDVDADIPLGLVEKVIERKGSFTVKNSRKFDFSKYLQIAAVFAAAICVGIVMGKNADIKSLHKKQNKNEQALIELKKKHHFSDINSFGRF